MTRHPDYPTNPPTLGPDFALGPVNFDGDTPPPDGYRCTICKASGVRLWRDYGTFLSHQTLHCFNCTILHAGGPKRKYDWDIERRGPDYTPDDCEIDGLVAAIPTAEDDTFWGYTSVPSEGVAWWFGLTPRPSYYWTEAHALKVQRDIWRKHADSWKRIRDSEQKNINAWIARVNDLEDRMRKAGLHVEDWRP